MFIAAVTMVLLPLIYIGLIVLAGYCVYYHAVNHVGILSAVRGRAWIVVLVIYLAPIIAGGIMVLFMIKPLFAARAKPPQRVPLQESEEPMLFELVRLICSATGAPVPSRIHVDTEVNASASFAGGLWSFLSGKLVLTIGLPLVAGLPLRHLVGVLAHEFGHFSQGGGMRMTFIVRSINAWFHRVVYERDSWDQALEEYANEADWRIAIILHLSRLLVWVTRKILWVLMVVGHAISCFMLRQMEYDADKYEIRLAGSEAFVDTVHRLQKLNLAQMKTNNDLGTSWQEKRLPDNLPALLIANQSEIPKEIVEEFSKVMAGESTGFFSTHPSDSDRISAANKQNEAGTFTMDVAARVVFHDFDATCKAATYKEYQMVTNSAVKKNHLVSTDELLAVQRELQQDLEASSRYFQDVLHPGRPLPFSEQELDMFCQPDDNAVQTLVSLREQKQTALPKLRQLFQQHGSRHDAYNAIDLDQAPADARSLTQSYADWAKQRLAAAISLLHHPEAAEHIADVDVCRVQANTYLHILARLGYLLGPMTGVTNDLKSMASKLQRLQAEGQNPTLVSHILKNGRELRQKLTAICREMKDEPYPYQHGQGQISIARYFAEEIPASDDIGELFETSQDILQKFYTLYYRTLGKMAIVAEKVEASFGLDPFPEPPDED